MVGRQVVKPCLSTLYHDEIEDWYKSLLHLIPFRLAAPPLQTGVVRPYLVQGAWFPSHLPLEGTSGIQIFRP
jgi:hypothetical protein